MNKFFIYLLIVFFLLPGFSSMAQIPSLPDSLLTNWKVSGPEEVVTYLIFDPNTVAERLPSNLRFITIGELSKKQIPWAVQYISQNPSHEKWGIAFIEVVKMETFEIDSLEPNWPEHGAAALWFARIEDRSASNVVDSYKSYLALDFWIPDSMFVNYMNKRGHFANFADVKLAKNSDGLWVGSINTDDLKMICECSISENTKTYSSGGKQVIYPPRHSGITKILRIAFAGHKIESCNESSFWKFSGSHPLTKAIILGPTTYQSNYELIIVL